MRSLKLSWIQRIENRIPRVKSLLGEDGWDLPKPLVSMIKACDRERNHIIGQISRLLRSNAPLVREAVFPLLQMATGCSQTTSTTPDVDLSPLGWTPKTVPLSVKTDIELSVRECFLARIDPFGFNFGSCDEFMGYRDACQRYMEQLDQIDNWQDPILSPHGTNFPLSEARIMGFLLQHAPKMEFPGLDYFGRHFVHVAFEVCEEVDIKLLTERMHADDFVNMVRHCCNDTGWSVLHIAAMRSMNCMFDRMLDLGHEPFDSMINAKDRQNNTPLRYAMKSKGSRTAQMILNLGANPSIVDGQERNALHHAVIQGHRDLVQHLISSDASLHTAFDKRGLTPFHLAIKYHQLEIVQLFPLNSIRVPGAGVSPLIMATQERNIGIIRWLLDRWMVGGVDHLYINGKDHDGRTALHLAASFGSLEAVELLVSKAANIRILDDFGRTPRDCAQNSYHYEVADYLLKLLPRAGGLMTTV
ncbi:ankyrin repeat-containing domain protein [Pestalotiopsis sp. NC0098]|nr:ankyrin repeat-containing domain protein [Pestalotiopsis sp. NC0098]